MRRMRIGFVGTGLMGGPMIRNLAAAGFEVQIYARDPDKMGDLPGKFAATVQDAVSGTDALCSVVTDSPDVEEVVDACERRVSSVTTRGWLEFPVHAWERVDALPGEGDERPAMVGYRTGTRRARASCTYT